MGSGILWFFGSCLWCFTPQLFGKEKSPCFEDNIEDIDQDLKEVSKADLFNTDEELFNSDNSSSYSDTF